VTNWHDQYAQFRDKMLNALLRKSALRRGADFGILTAFCGLGLKILSKEDAMCMLDEIRAKRDEIYAIARKCKAEKLWVFGSCARKEEHSGSDVDFLVKSDNSMTADDKLSFKFAVADMLGCRTDVVSVTQLLGCPRFARQVLKERVPV